MTWTDPVRDIPLVFPPEHIRKIHAGTKTQDCRLIKSPPPDTTPKKFSFCVLPMLHLERNSCYIDAKVKKDPRPTRIWQATMPYRKNDIIYVQERIKLLDDGTVSHQADMPDYDNRRLNGYCAPTRMKREHARFLLRVTDIRVIRLRSVTKEDAAAEGYRSVGAFLQSFYKNYGSAPADPWVWKLDFERLKS